MASILNRYIFRELAGPFLLALLVLTATMLLTKVLKLVELIVNHGAGAAFAGRFLLYALPGLLVYTVPISFLVAVLVAYGRMSSDNEITALKASGIGLGRLAAPTALFAGLLFIAALVISLYGLAWGNLSAREMVFEAARKRVNIALKEKTFNNSFKGLTLYAEEVGADGSVGGVFLYDETEGEDAHAITARRGEFITDPEGLRVTLRLHDGAVHSSGAKESYGVTTFQTYDIKPRLVAEDAGRTEGRRYNRELYAGELRALAAAAAAEGRDASPYLLEMHKRFSTPASVLVFFLVGIPLGIQRVRSPGLAGFTGAIAVVAVYFLLTLAMDAASSRKALPPAAAAWLPAVLIGAFGLYALYRETVDRPLKPLGYLGEGAAAVAALFKRTAAGGLEGKR